MNVSVYEEITVTPRIYRAIVKIRKSGAQIDCTRMPSRDGRCMIMKDVTITAPHAAAVLATSNLDRLLATS